MNLSKKNASEYLEKVEGMTPEEYLAHLKEEGRLWRVCPICDGRFELAELGREVACSLCHGRLIISGADLTGHQDSEVSSQYAPEQCFGTLAECLHPVGTDFCGTCELVYPSSFEICPGVVVHAIDMYIANRARDDAVALLDDRWEVLVAAAPQILKVQLTNKRLRAIKKVAVQIERNYDDVIWGR